MSARVFFGKLARDYAQRRFRWSVRVQIQKWGTHPNPNRIHTPSAVISVRGTTFDVTVSGEDESTLIAVEEGQVDVRHALKGDTKGAVAQRVLRALTDALYTMQTSGGACRVGNVQVAGGKRTRTATSTTSAAGTALDERSPDF